MNNNIAWHTIGTKEYEHDGQGYTGRYRECGETFLKRTYIKPIDEESHPAEEWLRLANKAGA